MFNGVSAKDEGPFGAAVLLLWLSANAGFGYVCWARVMTVRQAIEVEEALGALDFSDVTSNRRAGGSIGLGWARRGDWGPIVISSLFR